VLWVLDKLQLERFFKPPWFKDLLHPKLQIVDVIMVGSSTFEFTSGFLSG